MPRSLVAWGLVLMLAAPVWAAYAVDEATGVAVVAVDEWPAAGRLELATPAPNVTRAYLSGDRERTPLTVEFNADATRVVVHLPQSRPRGAKAVVLETAERSRQFDDGRIVFSALDAETHGRRAKLETHPGNHRIGFWSDADDFVSWEYRPTRPGTYDVELTYSKAGGAGTRVAIEAAGQRLETTLAPTGGWYRYTVVPVGKLKLPKDAKVTLAVKCLKKTGAAVMNLKAVTLRPTSEGTPPRQADDGTVTCHARDATIHGVKLQYEPQPHKNTAGYWVHPTDWLSWDVTITRPGAFAVEMLQGCGKGHGGSEVKVHLAGQTLVFTVEDTGHFQNFKPRRIGTVKISRPGTYTLEVRPVNKAAGAVMDLRQVRLLPAEEKR